MKSHKVSNITFISTTINSRYNEQKLESTGEAVKGKVLYCIKVFLYTVFSCL